MTLQIKEAQLFQSQVSTQRNRKWKFATAFISALCVINPYLSISQIYAIRATDIIIGILAIYFMLMMVTRGIRKFDFVITLVTLAYFSIFLLYSIKTEDVSRSIATTRIILSIPAGYIAAIFIVTSNSIKNVRNGIFFGLVCVLIISYGQRLEISIFLDMYPPESLRYWLLGGIRPNGLWGHPNENSIVFILSVAFLLLNLKNPHSSRRISTLSIFISLALISLFYSVVMSRSTIISFIIFIMYLAVIDRSATRKSILLFLVFYLLVMMAAFSSKILGERWFIQTQNITYIDQIFERLSSMSVGLSLSLSNPLGIAEQFRENLTELMRGDQAIHNGFIFFALQFGILPSIFLIFFTLRTALNRKATLYSPLIFYIVLMFFEDATTNPSSLLIVSFCLWFSYLEGRTCSNILHANEYDDKSRNLPRI